MGTGDEAPAGGPAEAVDAGGEEGLASGGVTPAARSPRSAGADGQGAL